MDEEILSRLLIFKNNVILAIQLKTGKKLITDGNKILAGKISGELASFILDKSKSVGAPITLQYKDELIYSVFGTPLKALPPDPCLYNNSGIFYLQNIRFFPRIKALAS